MNRSKAIGTRWETRLRDWFRVNGAPHCERLALSGKNDKGDLTGLGPGIVIEAKNHKQIDLAGWMDELEREMKNAGAEMGGVYFPRRNHPVAKGYVTRPIWLDTLLLRQAGWLGDE